MNTSALTLFGFLFTTLCTSVCPTGMAMASMNMGDMQMMAQQMGQETEKGMPCKKCEKEDGIEVSIVAPTVKIQLAHSMPIVYPPVTFVDTDGLHAQKVQLKNAINGPPPLSVSLVGTVVFRT